MDESYSELINEGIDELNAKHSFSGTELSREEQEQKPPSPYFRSWPFIALVSCTALSCLMWLGYFVFSSKQPVQRIDAVKLEVKKAVEKASTETQDPLASYLIRTTLNPQHKPDPKVVERLHNETLSE